ncbi:myb-related protein MYBAS2-like isoform X1 [Phoenix dactylifera]|uniref:Myb-related protein MYBAS2-like isoform X1 n=2 Tax=Phoenix dactylifera TaxID=42345 RepID=A0A8B7BGP5_PHODC|nr:myb-related protein MYBAS2-like isoform X1 [Phoenix dactylifera]
MVTVKEETRKGPWTEQEDQQLVCFVGLFGERRWDFIAKVSGLNRTGKSCRLRWVNYLHPGLKRGRMTLQEQRLILELHSRWGNRWSRIARKLPGRTDNEIKNYWRTHMRKKAQERKRDAISPSWSSSSLAYHSPSPSEPPPEVGLEQRELNEVGVCCCMTAGFDEEEEDVKGYSMDQIWNEIATPEAVSGLSFEECKNEVCDTSWPPMPSPMWEYSSELLWKMDDEEFKMFPPVDDLLVSNYQHGREFCN